MADTLWELLAPHLLRQEADYQSYKKRTNQDQAVVGAFLFATNFVDVDEEQVGNSNQHRTPRQDDGSVKDEQL